MLLLIYDLNLEFVKFFSQFWKNPELVLTFWIKLKILALRVFGSIGSNSGLESSALTIFACYSFINFTNLKVLKYGVYVFPIFYRTKFCSFHPKISEKRHNGGQTWFEMGDQRFRDFFIKFTMFLFISAVDAVVTNITNNTSVT